MSAYATTKKIVPLLICSLAVLSPRGAAQPAVEMPQTIRVVMDNAYAPYLFQSNDGKLQGILVDQWRAWEKKTGTKVEIHAMDWGEALRRMRAGEFDVIDCIVETAERRDYFEFTPSYATIEASIFFRSDISGIKDLASAASPPSGPHPQGCVALLQVVPITLKALKRKETDFAPQTVGDHIGHSRPTWNLPKRGREWVFNTDVI